MVRFGTGGGCTAEPPGGACITSAQNAFTTGEDDVAVCVGPGNNGAGFFSLPTGINYCTSDLDDVCAMFDRPLASVSDGRSTLCPAPHTRCISAASLGRPLEVSDWHQIFNTTPGIIDELPHDVTVPPTSQAAYACGCRGNTITSSGAVWNETWFAAEGFSHVGPITNHVPMPVCIAPTGRMAMPIPSFDHILSGLIEWPNVAGEPASPGEIVAAGVSVGSLPPLKVGEAVYARRIPFEQPEPSSSFRPVFRTIPSDGETSRVYCALLNRTAEALIRRGIWTAWPDAGNTETPSPMARVNATLTDSETLAPAVLMYPCSGESSPLHGNITLHGVSV